ncbi:MAG: ankyrin repeat domain-containing protein, partial [Gemmatimonadaceae bacterium]
MRKKFLGVIGLVLATAAATVAPSPVADAAMKGDIAAVRALIARGANVNAPHGDGMTALHWAAER